MPKGDAKEGYLNTNAHLEMRVALLMAQLAESQARELRLRNIAAQMACASRAISGADELVRLREALAMPSDDSALREMIEKARREEREAIIAEMPGGHSVDPQWVCDMIRARSPEKPSGLSERVMTVFAQMQAVSHGRARKG